MTDFKGADREQFLLFLESFITKNKNFLRTLQIITVDMGHFWSLTNTIQPHNFTLRDLLSVRYLSSNSLDKFVEYRTRQIFDESRGITDGKQIFELETNAFGLLTKANALDKFNVEDKRIETIDFPIEQSNESFDSLKRFLVECRNSQLYIKIRLLEETRLLKELWLDIYFSLPFGTHKEFCHSGLWRTLR